MKKLMVMLLMMVASAFASQLFALDGSPPGVKTFNSTSYDQAIYGKNDIVISGAAHTVDGVIIAKVNTLHKDNLMYSRDNGIDNKRIMETSGYKQNINLASITVAVVCYPRGETGV